MFSWNIQVIRTILVLVHDLEQWERDVVIIRLANELEEFLDFGLAYCGENRQNQSLYQEENFEAMVQLCHKLGYQKLGQELTKSFSTSKCIKFPLYLRGSKPPEQSFSLVPNSYQKLKDAVIRRLEDNPRPFKGPSSGV